jgi:ribonuclease PH
LILDCIAIGGSNSSEELMARADGRRANQLRPVTITRGYTDAAPGSVLIEAGRTRVLCTCSIEEDVPRWMKDADPPLGWVTSEYSMLPGSTPDRKRRGEDSRAIEIRRLIGRSLRAVVDRAKLGPRTLWIDCDVLQADGGTRTASITGAWVAMADAVNRLREQERVTADPFTGQVAAVSVGIVDGRALLDLDYSEDSVADVDMNIVMTGGGRFIEVQGTGEDGTFTSQELQAMLELGSSGIRKLLAAQRDALRD